MPADEESIGARLRAAREAPPYWSRAEMARRLRAAADPRELPDIPHVASLVSMIKQWEAGRYTPGRRYRPLYAQATSLSEADLFGTGIDVPLSGRAPELPDGDLPERLADVTGRRLGADDVAALAARAHRLRLADDVLSGEDLLGPAFRELDGALRVYRQASHSERTGRALLAVVGELAQIAGWIASDAGQHDRAVAAYRLGITAARQAGDRALLSQLIGLLGYQTTNLGAHGEGLALTQAALLAAGPDAPPRTRALAWDRVAWASARVQDGPAAVLALGEAEAALNSTGPADPDYLYWVDEGELQIMEARSYTELHRPLRAVPLLVRVLSRYDTARRRELALYLSWLVVALLDANEAEEAAEAAARMLEISAGLTSDRTSERARIVLERLRPYRDVPAVREVLDGHPPGG
ncbi:transcriptional regulator [Spirillospora sp. NPDC050679]